MVKFSMFDYTIIFEADKVLDYISNTDNVWLLILVKIMKLLLLLNKYLLKLKLIIKYSLTKNLLLFGMQ